MKQFKVTHYQVEKIATYYKWFWFISNIVGLAIYIGLYRVTPDKTLWGSFWTGFGFALFLAIINILFAIHINENKVFTIEHEEI